MATEMKLVDATTTQRVLSFLIDAAPLFLLWLFVLPQLLSDASQAAVAPEIISQIMTTNLVFMIISLAYTAFLWWWEATSGKTLGNLLLKIRTTDMNGNLPGWKGTILRRLLLGVAGIVPVAGPLLVAASNEFDKNGKRQGWHDKVAETLVVDIKAGRDPLSTGGHDGPSTFAPPATNGRREQKGDEIEIEHDIDAEHSLVLPLGTVPEGTDRQEAAKPTDDEEVISSVPGAKKPEISSPPVTGAPAKAATKAPAKSAAAKPEAKAPAKPAAAKAAPAKPAEDAASKPAEKAPAKQAPAKPAEKAPAKQAPAKPATDAASKPEAKAPAKPAAAKAAPAKPAADVAAKPAEKTPAKETPAKPAADAASKPAEKAPAKPAAKAAAAKPAANAADKVPAKETPAKATPAKPATDAGVESEVKAASAKPVAKAAPAKPSVPVAAASGVVAGAAAAAGVAAKASTKKDSKQDAGSEPVPASKPAEPVVPPVVPVPQAEPEIITPVVDSDPDADLGATRVRQSLDAEVHLLFDDGADIVVQVNALIGRNPVPAEGIEVSELLVVDDPQRTVSKTHVLVTAGDQGVWVTDQGSANGTYVIAPNGAEQKIEPGVPASAPFGYTVYFGERFFKVSNS